MQQRFIDSEKRENAIYLINFFLYFCGECGRVFHGTCDRNFTMKIRESEKKLRILMIDFYREITR